MRGLDDETAERYEFLREVGVLVPARDADTLVASEAYDAERGVYHDTYADCDEATFHGTLADLFAMDAEEAGERAHELGITREELVAYLSLRGYFKRVEPDETPEHDELLHLAGLVAGVVPASPVPESMPALGDDEYEAFLDEHPDAVVFVWRLHCAPCDTMKAEMDAILDVVPDDVAVAGVDGESVAAFRREFDVNSAPATLTFADDEFVECVTGRRSAEQLAEMFEVAFGQSAAS
jgi:thiol-disulfide isomerase/thioredoxin